jgi:hypothetical protein
MVIWARRRARKKGKRPRKRVEGKKTPKCK